jgi:hypothetical protein
MWAVVVRAMCVLRCPCAYWDMRGAGGRREMRRRRRWPAHQGGAVDFEVRRGAARRTLGRGEGQSGAACDERNGVTSMGNLYKRVDSRAFFL